MSLRCSSSREPQPATRGAGRSSACRWPASRPSAHGFLRILCAVLLWVYKAEIFSTVGTYAIAAQILCYALLGLGSCLLAFGLSCDQKAPMVLGVCTRNVGPALATLLGVADAPQGAITMCILAIFLGAILSGFAAAAVLRRYGAPAGELAAAQTAGGR